MCGRYSLSHDKEKIVQRFGVKEGIDFYPRYNVSPGQLMPVISGDSPLKVSSYHWGLIPSYSLDKNSAQHSIKCENILSRTPFKQILRSQRCLVLSDGYYDWRKEGKYSIPYRLTLASDEIFTMAGIWDKWTNPLDGDVIFTFSILTKAAFGPCKEISDRMPVILKKESEMKWIHPQLKDDALLSIFNDSEIEKLSYYKCHRIVNSSEFDVPQCIEAAPKLYPGETYNLFDL